ncbi:MAG TPA: N-6 DNA methylase, partial [Methanosphaera sp.]|nr:N-6 DNA methylase [Methanosphaera sp.]HIJ14892.1 N-6 DNA methylase [Methanosphaera sp.]
PTCILILKKNRKKDEGILFIDASKEFDNTYQLNKLRKEDIEKIIDTYKYKKEINRYSHYADIKEIKENDFNLNIKRYVNTYEEKEKIDIQETIKEIKQIKKNIHELNLKEEKLLNKLNIDFK